ncbi:MAG: hypothetical protein Q8M16_21645 [Pirellulaceae bacterium]|nr:hypothetical protein [Pirellulaceae bacterium]
MYRLDLSSATPQLALFLFRLAAILAIGSLMLGAVSLLLATDLPQISRRLWDIGLGTTVLAVLTTVLGLWQSHEVTNGKSV